MFAYTTWSKARLVSQSYDCVSQPVPCHREIKEHLAHRIVRMLRSEVDHDEG